MNKLFGTFLAVLLSVSIYAFSLNPNDSVSIGTGYTKMVFYNLSTGAQTEASNADWHLAISVRPSPIPPGGNPQDGAAIRINEQLGMSVAVAPRNNASTFDNIDTAGWADWTKLHDSDSKMIEGALNSNRRLSNPFDFGWGIYNQVTHNVMGDSVFIITLPNGIVKKFMVEGLIKDTAYQIKYSNLDNSDLQQVQIRKSLYTGKNFVYLNLADNSIHDKEPAYNMWDLQFLKYTGVNILGLPYYPVTGVWVNRGVSVAKAEGVDVMSNDYSGHTFATEMNTIGWDWKEFVAPGYSIADSLVYFTRTAQGQYFKLVFTGFGGSSNGMFRFYKEEIVASTSIEDVKDIFWNVYPNPVNEQLFINTNGNEALVKIFDLTGNIVAETQVTAAHKTSIYTGSLPNGIYVVSATLSNNMTGIRKIIVQH